MTERVRLNISLPGFYLSNELCPYTFRIEIRLKREVDGDILRRAVDTSMSRYPYFAVRKIVDGEEFVLEDNPLPVVVSEGLEPVCLSSEASNGHLIALAYEGNTVCFDVSHALMDATGALPWLKTILYYYLCEREQVQLDPSGIRLADSEILREEIDEPYPADVPEDLEPIGSYKPEPPLRLEEYTPTSKNVCYHVRISENAFVKYSKEQDGSPATLTSVFLAKAIAALHPDAEKPVIGGMALNMRPALGKPLAHNSYVPLLYLKYRAGSLGDPVTKLATCSRGMVILQSQPENVLIGLRRYIQLARLFRTMTHVQKLEMLSASSLAARSAATFSVSYVGRADWGSLEPYLDAAHISCGIIKQGIMVEIMAINSSFDLCFMQEFEDDKYVRQFAAELEREGIASEVSGPYPLRFPSEQIDKE